MTAHRCVLVPYDHPSHVAFCVKSYVESLHAQKYDDVPWSIARQPLHDEARAVLGTAPSVVVAHDETDPNWLQGWASAVRMPSGSFALLWVYVVFMRRKKGLGEALATEALLRAGRQFATSDIYYPHKTKIGEKLAKTLGATYNPWCHGGVNGRP